MMTGILDAEIRHIELHGALSTRGRAEPFKVEVGRLRFGTDPADYAMTHLSSILMMRPGDCRPTALPATSPPDAIAAALRTALEA